VDGDRFYEFLLDRVSKGVFEGIGTEARQLACKVIVDLCEALVTLGHGALIVIRMGTDANPALGPLNPVWLVEPNRNAPILTEGILTYALMAALDGATEIRLPQGEGPIAFAVRKCVVPKKEIWNTDEDGDAVLSPDFKDLVDTLGLVGKGTRHHSALALSADLKADAIVLTVSADGPVTLWQNGRRDAPEDDPDFQPRFRP
jgi:hypothetical protein